MSQPLQQQVRRTSPGADAILGRNVVLAHEFLTNAPVHVPPHTRDRLSELIAQHEAGAHLEGPDATELAIILQAVQQEG